ncbi:MAG: hypothetical protein J5J06_12580 [Phycisphaerae bacterium]|nr:hypothetical protein [Phycisphaerae bacterium]
MRNWFGSSTAVSLVLMLIAGRVSAGERRFTYVYESTTEKKGEWEFEQWVTWKTAKESNRDFDRFDFRTEIEYGVTDRLQLGFYVSDWRYEENRRENRHRGEWNNVALEGIWNLSDPNANFLGLALYGEVKVGDELLEVESKFIAQKNIGKLTLAYNAILEAEWEGHDYDEDNGELAQTFGLSYQVSPQFLAGAELLHELGIPDWRGVRGKAVLYLGPNFSYRAKKWWVTMTPLFQVSDIEDEPDFQARLLFGIPLGG